MNQSPQTGHTRETPRRLSVALVMPVRNEAESVDETMAAVFASTRLPDEIIIADACSEDDTVAKLEPWSKRGTPLKIVSNPSLYCGGGRNVGARNTECDIIVIADFGNPMRTNYIENMVKPFEEDSSVDATMGILLPIMNTAFEHCMGVIYYEENLQLEHLTVAEKEALLPEVLLPGGGCIALKRNFLLEMGGYPEWLARSQDRLFSLKAYCLGATVKVAWDAESLNHLRRGPKEVFSMAFGWARCNGQSRYLRRHTLKTVPFYSLVVFCILLGLEFPIALAGALLMFAAYVANSGVRRLLRVDGGIRRLSYLWHTVSLLIAGDLGTMVGQAVGWFEWLTQSRYRNLYWEYMSGCPRSKLHIIER